jgi:hypothetical protein
VQAAHGLHRIKFGPDFVCVSLDFAHLFGVRVSYELIDRVLEVLEFRKAEKAIFSVFEVDHDADANNLDDLLGQIVFAAKEVKVGWC